MKALILIWASVFKGEIHFWRFQLPNLGSRLEKLFFALLALFPFGMDAVYALINMTGGWSRFRSDRGYASYGVLPGGFGFWIGLLIAGVIFALAWIFSCRMRPEYRLRREVLRDVLRIFLTALILRLGFCLIFAHGVGNSWDPLWCWERVCGFQPSNNRHVLFPVWINFALYMKGFVLLFGNHYGLFQLMQTVWGVVGAVAVFLLSYELTQSRKISVFAGSLYAFSPSAMVYLSAGAFPEHQSAQLFCLAAWLFLRCIICEMSFKRLLAYSIAAGVCLGVADAIKPFFPVFRRRRSSLFFCRFQYAGRPLQGCIQCGYGACGAGCCQVCRMPVFYIGERAYV